MKIYQYQKKANMCGENVKKYRREQKVVADYELFTLSKALNVTIYDLLGLPNPK